MTRLALALLPVVAAFALPAFVLAEQAAEPPWAGLRDVHLDVVPRTGAERARIASVTAWPRDFGAPSPFEENAGGAQTVRARDTADAFSQPAANLTFAQELDFRIGNGMFRRIWLSPPASTIASDGLGPLYNARSCQRCHLKDGRGHPPEGPEDSAVSMVLRVSIPAPDLGTAEDILAWADPDDADGDGISGYPQIVWSDVHERPMLGRFGHKAGNPTVLEQTASAFAGDIGISNPIHPAGAGECTGAQTTCTGAPW